MGNLVYGDVFEQDFERARHRCESPLCDHWVMKPRWKIWLAWLLRLLGWDGPPS